MKTGKLSKKAIAKALEKDRRLHEGRAANQLEMDEAFQRLTTKLSKPETLAMLKRLKDK